MAEDHPSFTTAPSGNNDLVNSYKELMGKEQDVINHPDRNIEEMHDLIRGFVHTQDARQLRGKKVPY